MSEPSTRGSNETPMPPAPPGRGWPRAAALFGVTLAMSFAQPMVLIGVPFVALGLTRGASRAGIWAVGLLAAAVVLSGDSGEGLWLAERGWALLAAGWFAAITLMRPAAPFTRRGLGALLGAGLITAVVLAVGNGSGWEAVEWAVRERMSQGVSTALEAVRLLRGGEALPPALVTAVYGTAEVQVTVFPALLGLSSLAALGVAWWMYTRLATGSDQGLGPLREFRFNDHLVWLFIGGLLFLVLRWGDAVARVGANAVVFMGALYAVRGAAVVMFVSGGLSLIGYLLVGLGLLFVPPFVVTGAMVIGIGDTWLDVRSKAGSLAA